MKKLFTLLVCCSLSVPSFGVDWIKDRIYTSLSYSLLGVNYDVGFHYTDSVKISVGYVIKPTLDEEFGAVVGLMAKLHYHHKFENTGITPYITAGVGAVIVRTMKAKPNVGRADSIGENISALLGEAFKAVVNDEFFSYQIGSGINLPLSERTSVFAVYKLQRFHKIFHGIELGVSFNL
ncbi:P44/Msp2 family outer membrane protein [Wolbachia endosymbiont of Frankliniella intonsa]|uniref:P44/Msp2 family outer membrane protein n=1 Tax=Wolbachia endosymbiont of Frankliniella intonsa TaxID=2902422 RepID=UPI00244ECEF9|nr:P44/Msp2 family outer membrane protein [Wolbachia endosymbiont of Frankliniella intonsa]WGJ61944.1 P44/Msp2 family outer membrane protein [Wolbachia endosymbiont of Frankliniella intonsa]